MPKSYDSDSTPGRLLKTIVSKIWILIVAGFLIWIIITAVRQYITYGSDPIPNQGISESAGQSAEFKARDMDDVIEQLYWVDVEFAGISKEHDFEEANYLLSKFMFDLFSNHEQTLHELGIDPLKLSPYCITALAYRHFIAQLYRAESPIDAGPVSNTLFKLAKDHEIELMSARTDERTSSAGRSPQCIELNEELNQSIANDNP